jgi:hypothetical protein
MDLSALQPTDNLFNACDEVDWADVFRQVERDVGTPVSAEMTRRFDGTFDSLVNLVVESSEGTPLPTSS